ncbi:MAG: hypothetical protein L0220_21605 [Acidobacteria bacterium]|nr:hypothetical protein [Acidobacteriota bacterium]
MVPGVSPPPAYPGDLRFSNNLNINTLASHTAIETSTNSDFGKATASLRQREIQFGLKFTF